MSEEAEESKLVNEEIRELIRRLKERNNWFSISCKPDVSSYAGDVQEDKSAHSVQ